LPCRTAKHPAARDTIWRNTIVTRSSKAAKTAFAVVVKQDATDILSPDYSRADMVKRLVDANAKERLTLLSALPIGEIAALGGINATIGASINEALAHKLALKHGRDWANLIKQLPSQLCDADKERAKDIKQSLEELRETIAANCGGDKDKARNVLHRVKEWGRGERKAKGANSNVKRDLHTHLKSWDVMPSLYRRIMNDEGANESDMTLADAVAAWFSSNGIKPQSVLECKGPADWNA
jgi:hypothetical protein